ncbi:hypothetical protein D3C87_76650 [compost metagenome]
MFINLGNYGLDFSNINECPICNSKIENSYKRCKNNCFCAHSGYVIIFSEIIIADKNHESEIAEKIKYWRTNDRYIFKIMEGL